MLFLNSLTTVGYLLSLFQAMDTFFGPYFHFLEPAMETWAKASLTPSLRVHDPNHTHSLASFQWSGFSDQRALQLTESCLQIQKWCPYKVRGVVPEPVCANKARNGPAIADQGSSLASQGWTHPPPPTPPFLLVQNLSLKRIAPTDNMWTKSDDTKWRHRWLTATKDRYVPYAGLCTFISQCHQPNLYVNETGLLLRMGKLNDLSGP